MVGASGSLASETRQLSDLLAAIELSGQTWCYADLGPSGGYSAPPMDGIYFHAVLHGSVRLATASEGLVELSAGEVVFVMKGEGHALRLTAESPAPTLEFLREERQPDFPPSFQLGMVGPSQARVLSGRLAASFPAGASRAALPALLRPVLSDSSPLSALITRDTLAQAGIGEGSAAVLTRLVSLMLVLHLRSDPECRQMLFQEHDDPIGQVLQLIAGNPSANWTVERLARSVRMGRSNFAAHFTAQTGHSPMEVVAEHRMEQAAQLLRKGTLKIAEIGELCGYGSEAAFSRRFTRHFGTSPSQMRDSFRRADAAEEAAPAWKSMLAAGALANVVEQVRSRARVSSTGASASANRTVPGRHTFLPPRSG